MIEQLHDMPSNTIGFRTSGKLSREDYRDVLEPVLSAAADSGEIRMLFELTDFDGLQPGAWFDDVKTGLGLGFGHHSAWKRSAIVTDVTWWRRRSSCSAGSPRVRSRSTASTSPTRRGAGSQPERAGRARVDRRRRGGR